MAIPPNLKKRLQKVLRTLWSKDLSSPFRESPDGSTENVFFSQHSFRSIGLSLDKDEYDTPEKFRADICGIFTDAIRFFPNETDPTHEAAQQCQKMFDKWYEKAVSSPSPSVSSSVPSNDGVSYLSLGDSAALVPTVTAVTNPATTVVTATTTGASPQTCSDAHTVTTTAAAAATQVATTAAAATTAATTTTTTNPPRAASQNVTYADAEMDDFDDPTKSRRRQRDSSYFDSSGRGNKRARQIQPTTTQTHNEIAKLKELLDYVLHCGGTPELLEGWVVKEQVSFC